MKPIAFAHIKFGAGMDNTAWSTPLSADISLGITPADDSRSRHFGFRTFEAKEVGLKQVSLSYCLNL